MLVLPFDSTESSLEKDAKLFIEEEDNLGETRSSSRGSAGMTSG